MCNESGFCSVFFKNGTALLCSGNSTAGSFQRWFASEKIPTQQEPDAEPSIAPKASLHSIATDLRSWYRTVVFLDYGGIRQLRVKSALQVLRPSHEARRAWRSDK